MLSNTRTHVEDETWKLMHWFRYALTTSAEDQEPSLAQLCGCALLIS